MFIEYNKLIKPERDVIHKYAVPWHKYFKLKIYSNNPIDIMIVDMKGYYDFLNTEIKLPLDNIELSILNHELETDFTHHFSNKLNYADPWWLILYNDGIVDSEVNFSVFY